MNAPQRPGGGYWLEEACAWLVIIALLVAVGSTLRFLSLSWRANEFGEVPVQNQSVSEGR